MVRWIDIAILLEIAGGTGRGCPRACDDTKIAKLLLVFVRERDRWIAGIAAHPGVTRMNIVLDGPGLVSAQGWHSLRLANPAQRALKVLYAAPPPRPSTKAAKAPTTRMA